ncbi:MAG: LCP family protein [Patescibacteria group bacterium]
MKKVYGLTLYIVVILSIVIGVFMTKMGELAKNLEVSPLDIVKPVPKAFASKPELNFLILGIGGGDHEGPTLSDSITIAKLDLKSNTLHTLGIPRDVWVPEIQDKINSIYAYSLNDDHKNESFDYTKTHFSDFTGQSIDSMVVIDFRTFESVIDALDGITITLKKGFIDPEFPKEGYENAECSPYDPNYGCRYTELIFPKGTYKINGKTALNLVRSRHAEGEEGTDFSRNARQQMVIQSIKNRIMELVSKHELTKLMDVANILNKEIARDHKNADYIPLIRELILSQKGIKIESHTFTEDYFEVPPYSEYQGRYVLVPKDKDYEAFKNEIKKLLQ